MDYIQFIKVNNKLYPEDSNREEGGVDSPPPP